MRIGESCVRERLRPREDIFSTPAVVGHSLASGNIKGHWHNLLTSFSLRRRRKEVAPWSWKTQPGSPRVLGGSQTFISIKFLPSIKSWQSRQFCFSLPPPPLFTSTTTILISFFFLFFSFLKQPSPSKAPLRSNHHPPSCYLRAPLYHPRLALSSRHVVFHHLICANPSVITIRWWKTKRVFKGQHWKENAEERKPDSQVFFAVYLSPFSFFPSLSLPSFFLLLLLFNFFFLLLLLPILTIKRKAYDSQRKPGKGVIERRKKKEKAAKMKWESRLELQVKSIPSSEATANNSFGLGFDCAKFKTRSDIRHLYLHSVSQTPPPPPLPLPLHPPHQTGVRLTSQVYLHTYSFSFVLPFKDVALKTKRRRFPGEKSRQKHFANSWQEGEIARNASAESRALRV